MNTKKLLSEVKKIVKIKGTAKVAHGLRYKSPNTIQHWISAGRIPPIAAAKVEKYLARVSR